MKVRPAAERHGPLMIFDHRSSDIKALNSTIAMIDKGLAAETELMLGFNRSTFLPG
jgi:hypothetical protein